MRAWVLEKQARIEERPLKLVEVPTPHPQDGEVRIKILVCGVCRTDIHIVEGDLPLRKSPHTYALRWCSALRNGQRKAGLRWRQCTASERGAGSLAERPALTEHELGHQQPHGVDRTKTNPHGQGWVTALLATTGFSSRSSVPVGHSSVYALSPDTGAYDLTRTGTGVS